VKSLAFQKHKSHLKVDVNAADVRLHLASKQLLGIGGNPDKGVADEGMTLTVSRVGVEPWPRTEIRFSMGVPFIFSSMLSMRTRLNSCTSC
jgi:hypothetical protein